jgi:hypothetical protein
MQVSDEITYEHAFMKREGMKYIGSYHGVPIYVSDEEPLYIPYYAELDQWIFNATL